MITEWTTEMIEWMDNRIMDRFIQLNGHLLPFYPTNLSLDHFLLRALDNTHNRNTTPL